MLEAHDICSELLARPPLGQAQLSIDASDTIRLKDNVKADQGRDQEAGRGTSDKAAMTSLARAMVETP